MQAGWLSARPPAPPSDRHPKQSSAPWDGQSQSAPESARQPHRGRGVCACGRTKGLSSGQTIGAVRTAVRPACCLPELRGANRLRRLCPLGTRFPTFPPAPLREVGVSRGHGYVPSNTPKGFPPGQIISTSPLSPPFPHAKKPPLKFLSEAACETPPLPLRHIRKGVRNHLFQIFRRNLHLIANLSGAENDGIP